MNGPSDKEYFRSRVIDEFARAEAATDYAVAQIDRELAERYQLLVDLSKDGPKAR